MTSHLIRQLLLGLFAASAGAGLASVALVEVLVRLGRRQAGQGPTGVSSWPTRRPGAFLAARIGLSVIGAGLALYLVFRG